MNFSLLQSNITFLFTAHMLWLAKSCRSEWFFVKSSFTFLVAELLWLCVQLTLLFAYHIARSLSTWLWGRGMIWQSTQTNYVHNSDSRTEGKRSQTRHRAHSGHFSKLLLLLFSRTKMDSHFHSLKTTGSFSDSTSHHITKQTSSVEKTVYASQPQKYVRQLDYYW